MAEAIILGSGTSNGVPMLGYRYPDGYLKNPKNNRTRSSLLFCGPSGNVLVDCPPEMRLQLTRAGIYEIEAVIVTHTHADHEMPSRLELAGLNILRFIVEHGSTRVIGVRVNDLAYITDVSYIPPEAEAMLFGLETLI